MPNVQMQGVKLQLLKTFFHIMDEVKNEFDVYRVRKNIFMSFVLSAFSLLQVQTSLLCLYCMKSILFCVRMS